MECTKSTYQAEHAVVTIRRPVLSDREKQERYERIVNATTRMMEDSITNKKRRMKHV